MQENHSNSTITQQDTQQMPNSNQSSQSSATANTASNQTSQTSQTFREQVANPSSPENNHFETQAQAANESVGAEQGEGVNQEASDVQIDSAALLIRNNELETELQQAEEKSLRVLSEMENLKRRQQRDADSIRKFSTESLIKQLLPLIDSFDSARQSIPDANQSVLEGLQLIEENFIKVLQENSVEVVDPALGEMFNPEFHQAMTTSPKQPDQETNQITQVFQRGFLLNGRLIRPAMVIVAS